MAHEGTELFAAGSGPSSRTMSFAVYHLLTNPGALARLQVEIMQAMPDIKIIPSAKSLEELPWLVRIPYSELSYEEKFPCPDLLD